jgi:hypothetical protein
LYQVLIEHLPMTQDIEMTQDDAMLIDESSLSGPAEWWKEEGVEAPFVSSYSPYTREYRRADRANPSPLEPGVWLVPACAVLGKPEASARLGHVMRLADDGKGWEEVEDHRGKTVYSVETGEAQVWEVLGAIPATHTLQEPGQYDQWSGDEWVEDEAAKTRALQANATLKKRLLNQLATDTITRLNYAVELDMATPEEVAEVKAWKVYLVLLGRLDASQSVPETADWPTCPAGEGADAWLESQGFDEIDAAGASKGDQVAQHQDPYDIDPAVAFETETAQGEGSTGAEPAPAPEAAQEGIVATDAAPEAEDATKQA